MRTFLIADPSQKVASSRGLWVEWVSDPSSLRVGGLVALYLHCVPRGAQGKKPPQSPGGGRRGRSVEDHLEKPTLGETLEGTLRLAGGVPVVRSACDGRTPDEGIREKLLGLSETPLLPSLWVDRLRSFHRRFCDQVLPGSTAPSSRARWH